jgi:hypothetical protein
MSIPPNLGTRQQRQESGRSRRDKAGEISLPWSPLLECKHHNAQWHVQMKTDTLTPGVDLHLSAVRSRRAAPRRSCSSASVPSCRGPSAATLLSIVGTVIYSVVAQAESLAPVPYLSGGGVASLMVADGETFAVGSGGSGPVFAFYDSNTRSYDAVRNSRGDLIGSGAYADGWLDVGQDGRFGVFVTGRDPATGQLLPGGQRRIYRWDRSTHALAAISRRSSDGSFFEISISTARVSEDGSIIAVTRVNGGELWVWQEGEGPTQKTPVLLGGCKCGAWEILR